MKIAEAIFRTDTYTKPTGGSLYGWRKHPITGLDQFHQGTDYATQKRNLPLFGVEKGYIQDVGFNNTVGNYVNVAYPRIDLIAIHRHLDRKDIFKNQKVEKGTLLGITGNTGGSTGIHLHLGLKRISTGEYIDPEKFDYQEHYINGIWDEQFTRDIQTYLKEHHNPDIIVDGITSGQNGNRKNIKKVTYGVKGSMWVKELQKLLGMKINGQLDVYTLNALQRKLGLIPDGVISEVSRTVRILQTRMSEGWLI